MKTRRILCGFNCTGVVGIILLMCGLASSKVFYNVTCRSDIMTVTLNLTNHPSSIVYLQNLKGYPGCEPEVRSGFVTFRLKVNETSLHCGVTKMLNKQTGHNIFYHRVVIEAARREREMLFVQCVMPGDFSMDFVRADWRRESVPFNYSTNDSTVETNGGSSAVPYVEMSVRDKGVRLDTSAVVRPGSLLDLLVYLDKSSADHYDLSLRYLTLADATRSQEEVLVMNGCPVDPFVLQVFRPSGGVLRSQFRAFRFQSSEFVVFLATVSVCLQKCVEVECYGEADGSGRRKREIPKFLPHYDNERFEVEVAAFLRLMSRVDGDIIVEESTNDTLDTIYDEDYSGDSEMFAAENLQSRSSATVTASHNVWAVCIVFFITLRTMCKLIS